MIKVSKTRIVLADDHAFVRSGVKKLIEHNKEYQVILEADNLVDLEQIAFNEDYDLLVLDYKMPGGDSYGIAEEVKKKHPEKKVILLTGIQSSTALNRLANSDIDALLLKEGPPEELLDAIKSVLSGNRYLSPLVEPYLTMLEVNLTGRELQILNMIVMGFSRSEISEQLDISAETVKSHRKNIMKKLEVHTVTELIIKAQELKLLEN